MLSFVSGMCSTAYLQCIVLFLPLCDVGLMKNFVVVWLQSEASHLNVKKLDVHHANFHKPNIAEVILVCGNYKLVDCCSLNPSGVFWHERY